MPAPLNVDPATLAEWTRLYEGGMGCTAIKRQTGATCRSGTIQDHLERAGVEMRTHFWRTKRARKALLDVEAMGFAAAAKANGISLARIERLWRTGRSMPWKQAVEEFGR